MSRAGGDRVRRGWSLPLVVDYPGGTIVEEQRITTAPMTLPSSTTARVGDHLDYAWPDAGLPGTFPGVWGASAPDAYFACMSTETAITGATRATATVIAQISCSTDEPNHDLHGDVIVRFSVDFAGSLTSWYRRIAGKPMRFTP